MNFRNEYLEARCSQVDEAFKKAVVWAAKDPELDAYLGGYFAVMISGVFEDCVEHLIWERANRTDDKELASLVQLLIDQNFRNPDAGKILRLVKCLSAEYVEKYRSRVKERHSTALDSIVTNKNDLGHGTLKKNVTVSDVRDYFQRAVPILEALETILC